MNPLTSLLSRLSQGKARQDYDSILPTFPEGQSIPKHIWRIFITQGTKKVPLPEIAIQTEQTLRELNPEYKITMVDNQFVEPFIRENYGDIVWSYYLRIDPSYGAVRADFLRYLILYKEGGIYTDLKISVSKPFRETILESDQLLLSHWDNLPGEEHEGWGHLEGLESIPRGEYIMGVIIAAPGHPFLREVILEVMRNIDTYNPYIHNTGFSGTLWLTGPVLYTLVAKRMQEDGILGKDSLNWREVSFAHDLGIAYTPVQLKGLSNYRQNVTPLIATSHPTVSALNRTYFNLISWYRRRILKQGK